jgi:glycosyltransferase involved in cell wall biosynthesis
MLLWYWGRRGAGGQLTLALAEALQRRPDTMVALSLSAQADLLPDLLRLGLPADAVPTYSSSIGFATGLFRTPALAQRLVAQARALRADVVLSVMTHLWTPLVAPALRRAGVPFVPIVHDAAPHPGDFSLAWSWRLERELDAATAALVLSDAVAAQVKHQRPDLPLGRLALGAHLPDWHVPHCAASRRGNGVRFLLFGRLRAYKGLDLLRDAWPLVRAQQPDAQLSVVGEGDAETLAPGLSALPGVTVDTRWIVESDIPALMAGADVVVQPYREASQSGVVPLALALGVPVVATPVGGLREQLADGRNGLLASRVDATAIAEAMVRLCDPVLRQNLARGAAEAGVALMDWDRHAEAMLAQLRRLLQAGPE